MAAKTDRKGGVAGQDLTPGAELIDLGESLTIPEVGAVLDRFRMALDRGQGLRIGAGSLEQVDGAGVQLLCVIVKATHAQDQVLVWQGVSPVLRAAVQQLGLEQELGW